MRDALLAATTADEHAWPNLTAAKRLMPEAANVQRLGTSLRSQTATQTTATAQRLQARLGVAEVLDITALDHLGLPVFVSLRPGGQPIPVHSGKGLSTEDARVGALMEAVEYAACQSASEHTSVQRMPLAKLAAQWPQGLPISAFAPRLGVAVRPRAHVPYVSCELLGTRRRAPLPSELVLLPAPAQRSPPIFGSSSNGLASGNTLQEATLHALLEVIERDTVALQMARDESRALALTSLPEPFAGLSQAWRRRNVRLHVRYLPNALGLPCFEAGLHEPAAGNAAWVLSRGWGLHFDRQIALSRAICEAAQSRLCAMLATRPDVTGGRELAARLGAPPAPERTALLLARLIDTRRRVRFEQLPHEAIVSIPDALRSLLQRLPAAGLGPVFRHRLHFNGDPQALKGLHVVKVVVANSESPVGQVPRLGPRLFARLQGH